MELVIGFQISLLIVLVVQLVGTAGRNPTSWRRIVIVAASVLVLVELDKFLLHRFEESLKISRLCNQVLFLPITTLDFTFAKE